VGTPPNLWHLRRDIIAIGAPWFWWPFEPDLVATTSGLITVVTDIIAGRALTYASGHRPTYDTSDPIKPHAALGGTHGGATSTGPLSGKTGATAYFVYRDGGKTSENAYMLSYVAGIGETNGRGLMISKASSTRYLRSYMQGASLKQNWWAANAVAQSTTGFHTVTARQKWADGTTATKPIRLDGSDLAGSRSPAQDVSAETQYASGNYLLHGFDDPAWGATWDMPDVGDYCDILLCPYHDDATCTLVEQALVALRGL
jgi:hypothetical protein